MMDGNIAALRQHDTRQTAAESRFDHYAPRVIEELTDDLLRGQTIRHDGQNWTLLDVIEWRNNGRRVTRIQRADESPSPLVKNLHSHRGRLILAIRDILRDWNTKVAQERLAPGPRQRLQNAERLLEQIDNENSEAFVRPAAQSAPVPFLHITGEPLDPELECNLRTAIYRADEDAIARAHDALDKDGRELIAEWLSDVHPELIEARVNAIEESREPE